MDNYPTNLTEVDVNDVKTIQSDGMLGYQEISTDGVATCTVMGICSDIPNSDKRMITLSHSVARTVEGLRSVENGEFSQKLDQAFEAHAQNENQQVFLVPMREKPNEDTPSTRSFLSKIASDLPSARVHPAPYTYCPEVDSVSFFLPNNFHESISYNILGESGVVQNRATERQSQGGFSSGLSAGPGPSRDPQVQQAAENIVLSTSPKKPEQSLRHKRRHR